MSATPTSPIGFHRAPPPSRAAELVLQGYTRRTTASGPRLAEIVDEYRRIGFEVELVDRQADADGCNVCFEGDSAGQYKDVFVRNPAQRPATAGPRDNPRDGPAPPPAAPGATGTRS